MMRLYPDPGRDSGTPLPPAEPWWQDLAGRAADLVLAYPIEAAGIVLGLAALLLIRRAMSRTKRPDRVLRRVVGLGIIGFSAEGMWEFTRQILEFPVPLAITLFIVFDAALLLECITAELAKHGSREQRVHIKAVWVTAVVMGVVVATGAARPSEALLRFILPLLAAGMWQLGLKRIGEDTVVERDENALTWTIVPRIRQLIIAWGLALPGERDRQTVDRDRLAAQLRDRRFRLHQAEQAGDEKLVRKLTAQLQRDALRADDGVLAEAGAAVQRAILAVAATRPLTADEHDRVLAAEAAAATAHRERVLAEQEAAAARSATEGMSSRVVKIEERLAAEAEQAAARHGAQDRLIEGLRADVLRLESDLSAAQDQTARMSARANALASEMQQWQQRHESAAQTRDDLKRELADLRAQQRTASETQKSRGTAPRKSGTSAQTRRAEEVAARALASLGRSDPRAQATAAAIAAAYLSQPAGSVTGIAAAADVSVATANRYLPAIRSAAGQINNAQALTAVLAASTPIPDPGQPVATGVNGHAHTEGNPS